MEEEKIIEERKKKISGFFKKNWVWVFVFLVIALILGAYIRTLPMQDHSKGAVPSLFTFISGGAFSGQPGLWNIATNDWTLGPDLDPWLFVRDAKTIVKDGSLPHIDNLRNVPLGFDNSIETQLLPYMIAGTYYLLTLFGIKNINLAGALYPVIVFMLTIIAMFLFVREIFVEDDKKSKTKANIIALISTFFMIVIPSFLPRTVAGIPEKESAAFFFMFIAFYLFFKAWKAKKISNSIIFGLLAGIATSLMSLDWGGGVYVFVTIAVATLVAFMLNKVHKKEVIIYAIWVISSFTIYLYFSAKSSLIQLISSLDTGLVTLTLFIIVFNFILWETKIKDVLGKIKFFRETKIPKNILTIIIGFILIIVIATIILGPGFFLDKINGVYKVMFNPTTGRWSTTVAENRQPYFTEWASEFGPYLQNLPNVPIMFWLFFIGSVVLIKSLLSKLYKKDSWILTGLYVLFFFGLVFSRYSGSSIFNGENFISKAFYIGSALLFIAGLIYYYIRYERTGNKAFEDIRYSYFILFVLFILCLFTARSAVRLIMVLATVAPIFAGFLIVESIEKFRNAKDETWKIILGALMILFIVASAFCFYSFYQTITSQSYSYIPGYYNQQWQKAMKWVDDETPKNAVFAHWWDYGYWVQSIGNRATVVDGGNDIVFWNYYMGRLVLTGDNQNDSLNFLYNHNATYLLIDSSDIGKYGAFSSIGSDKNYDRYSWIGTFLMDETQTQETKNQTSYVYTGGIALDEDLVIDNNGKQIMLPAQKTGVGAIIVPTTTANNGTQFLQPYTIMVYNGVQQKVYLRYLSVEGKFIDFKTGIEGCADVIPEVIPDNQGRVSKNEIGTIIFLSPRLMRGYLAQKYILNDPFNKFPNFKVAHIEPSLIGTLLNNQGMNLPNIFYFQGVQGPITIWDIKYTGKEILQQKYIDRDASKYLDWEM